MEAGTISGVRSLYGINFIVHVNIDPGMGGILVESTYDIIQQYAVPKCLRIIFIPCTRYLVIPCGTKELTYTTVPVE